MGLLLNVVYLRHRAETAEGITETESVYNLKTPRPPPLGVVEAAFGGWCLETNTFGSCRSRLRRLVSLEKTTLFNVWKTRESDILKCTVHTLHFSVQTSCFRFLTSHFIIHSSEFRLHTHTSEFRLHTSHFILHSSNFIVHTSHFLLHIFQSLNT